MKKLESQEQIALLDWCAWSKYPELRLIFHIPNGGSRNVIEATNLKKQGVRAGVPDLFLPVARNGYHGLFIEMKSIDGRLSENQKIWLKDLGEQGYKTTACYSSDQAIEVIKNYMREEAK